MSDFTEFDYLLNSFEQASQADKPAEHGYGDKRRALYAYVRKLEAAALAQQATGEPDAWLITVRGNGKLRAGTCTYASVDKNERREDPYERILSFETAPLYLATPNAPQSDPHPPWCSGGCCNPEDAWSGRVIEVDYETHRAMVRYEGGHPVIGAEVAIAAIRASSKAEGA